MSRRLFLPATLVALLLGACASGPQLPQRTPEEVKADIARRIPARAGDRQGWANDIYVALSARDLATTPDNICAVLAVIEQESGWQADPAVPGLGRIAREELRRRAATLHVPGFVVDTALKLESPDGRSYGERIDTVRTERELSELFEEMTARVPMGQRLLGGFNPVHTGGPMQVSIDFAEAHAREYPYPLPGSVRQEVFTRRGGVYFGTAHLLDYPASYESLIYRYADFNAGWYASRNAAFQVAVARASGIELALDGDLLLPGADLEHPGATERAVHALSTRLDMDAREIRRALQKGDSPDFEKTALYRRVYELAEQAAGKPLPRAVLPGIKLQSPKITRNLTTAWFANRVDERWQRCMKR
ncbi:hypothetical protein CSC70_03305 [Pseudoxanthomonas kalamensis DSM 18571]|uniref:DUF1615 domain-containing protein n=1 Tax=Pseudoxanthomonas kalamensis TaxID=289483 RepID=UPI001391AE9F|nr:DUF1615 domain-containing protein [Pseudoxanthomonas kalamensis]KAF1712551.1 hypothetical protein CSC70_03305 [Pseudoxanthomonas kalamensis DSM 18571]